MSPFVVSLNIYLQICWRQVTLGEIPGTISQLKTWRFSITNITVLIVKQFCNLPIRQCSIPFDHTMLCLSIAVHISVPTRQSQSWRRHSCLSIFSWCNTWTISKTSKLVTGQQRQRSTLLFQKPKCPNATIIMFQIHLSKTRPTRCVSHCGLAVYIKKYLKAKRRIMETQIFHHAKIYLSFKKSSKRNQNPSRYYNSITNLKFQHKPKYHLSKILK